MLALTSINQLNLKIVFWMQIKMNKKEQEKRIVTTMRWSSLLQAKETSFRKSGFITLPALQNHKVVNRRKTVT